MTDPIESVRRALTDNADEKVRESGMRFFREAVDMYGVRSGVVVSIGKEVFKTSCLGYSKEEVFSLCETLWQSGKMEESFIACNWSYAVRKSYTSDDMRVFEAWVSKYVTNWASCDTLCNHTVGTLIDCYPDLLTDLKRWAHSPDRWMKRAAAVSLIIPARQGRYLNDIFDIADILLTDSDDMVQKGYGWMLKAASQAHQQEVFDYVFSNKMVMPRTALRYAIEKMPDDMRKQAMAK